MSNEDKPEKVKALKVKLRLKAGVIDRLNEVALALEKAPMDKHMRPAPPLPWKVF